MRGILFLSLLVAPIGPSMALAHGGGLDASGCHHDRKRGGYHCHQGSGAAPPSSRAADRPPRIAGNTYYANCTAARAAGAAPVRQGDPGYASHLDRDGDGIGCE